ncbi:uncharacterized protein MONBRDRAFT_34767 [Monosiga brevicollis MX1]|uniref:Uncharacterized protein n=1 Tax=Monosiga brevicollis TaxID=81824 RepID=A9VDX1_MONBE|nr:uncharacterized protein MONBRDRAFT_34767 [Monosiga brevicollis MX1]EDQ84292.1 predicted protein [Monosiga brevicollis MX1]|eukprot:XP_001750922.1 hypothetical protein [Monosiga brevicollis MX1]
MAETTGATAAAATAAATTMAGEKDGAAGVAKNMTTGHAAPATIRQKQEDDHDDGERDEQDGDGREPRTAAESSAGVPAAATSVAGGSMPEGSVHRTPLSGKRSMSSSEIRDPTQNPRLKTRLCTQFMTTGSCRYGDKCIFAHGPHELRGANATMYMTMMQTGAVNPMAMAAMMNNPNGEPAAKRKPILNMARAKTRLCKQAPIKTRCPPLRSCLSPPLSLSLSFVCVPFRRLQVFSRSFTTTCSVFTVYSMSPSPPRLSHSRAVTFFFLSLRSLSMPSNALDPVLTLSTRPSRLPPNSSLSSFPDAHPSPLSPLSSLLSRSLSVSMLLSTLYSLLPTLYSLIADLFSLLSTPYSLLSPLPPLLPTLYSLISDLYSLLSTLWSLISTPYSLLSTLYSLLSTLYSLLSTLYSLLSTLYSLLSTLYSLLSTLYSLLSTLYSLLSTLYSLLSTLYSLLSTLPTLLSLLYSLLSLLYSLLSSPPSPLSPLSSLLSTLYSLLSTLPTLLSLLYSLLSLLYSLLSSPPSPLSPLSSLLSPLYMHSLLSVAVDGEEEEEEDSSGGGEGILSVIPNAAPVVINAATNGKLTAIDQPHHVAGSFLGTGTGTMHVSPPFCSYPGPVTVSSFQRRSWWRQLKRIHFPLKGFGIITTADIPAGTFVMEYVGQVLSTEQFAERVATTYENRKHFHCLNLDGGLVIDAGKAGCDARYINHSCHWRVGIFAKRPIRAGEELTYDYNFESFKEDMACHCGASNCRGFIRPKARDDRLRRTSRLSALRLAIEEGTEPAQLWRPFFWHKGSMESTIEGQRNFLQAERIEAERLQQQAQLMQSTFQARFAAWRRSSRVNDVLDAHPEWLIDQRVAVATTLHDFLSLLSSHRSKTLGLVARPLMRALPRLARENGVLTWDDIAERVDDGQYKNIEDCLQDLLALCDAFFHKFARGSKEHRSILAVRHLILKNRGRVLQDQVRNTSEAMAVAVRSMHGDAVEHGADANRNVDDKTGVIAKTPWSDHIRCVCESLVDEGNMVQCCSCGTWQHVVCMGTTMAAAAEVQDYRCWLCAGIPRSREVPLDSDVERLADQARLAPQGRDLQAQLIDAEAEARAVEASRDALHSELSEAKASLQQLTNRRNKTRSFLGMVRAALEADIAMLPPNPARWSAVEVAGPVSTSESSSVSDLPLYELDGLSDLDNKNLGGGRGAGPLSTPLASSDMALPVATTPTSDSIGTLHPTRPPTPPTLSAEGMPILAAESASIISKGGLTEARTRMLLDLLFSLEHSDDANALTQAVDEMVHLRSTATATNTKSTELITTLSYRRKGHGSVTLSDVIDHSRRLLAQTMALQVYDNAAKQLKAKHAQMRSASRRLASRVATLEEQLDETLVHYRTLEVTNPWHDAKPALLRLGDCIYVVAENSEALEDHLMSSVRRSSLKPTKQRSWPKGQGTIPANHPQARQVYEVMRIEMLWRDANGQPWLTGRCFFFPEHSMREPRHQFHPQELAFSPEMRSIPAHLYRGHCCVLHRAQYISGRPTRSGHESHVYLVDRIYRPRPKHDWSNLDRPSMQILQVCEHPAEWQAFPKPLDVQRHPIQDEEEQRAALRERTAMQQAKRARLLECVYMFKTESHDLIEDASYLLSSRRREKKRLTF